MGKARKHTPEQIVNILRQIEVAVANGKTHPIASREAGITEQTYYRWRKEYGGLKVDQAKRLKELEQENSKLKRLVAEWKNHGLCRWAYRWLVEHLPPKVIR
jgi:transposase-like protein